MKRKRQSKLEAERKGARVSECFSCLAPALTMWVAPVPLDWPVLDYLDVSSGSRTNYLVVAARQEFLLFVVTLSDWHLSIAFGNVQITPTPRYCRTLRSEGLGLFFFNLILLKTQSVRNLERLLSIISTLGNFPMDMSANVWMLRSWALQCVFQRQFFQITKWKKKNKIKSHSFQYIAF